MGIDPHSTSVRTGSSGRGCQNLGRGRQPGLGEAAGGRPRKSPADPPPAALPPPPKPSTPKPPPPRPPGPPLGRPSGALPSPRPEPLLDPAPLQLQLERAPPGPPLGPAPLQLQLERAPPPRLPRSGASGPSLSSPSSPSQKLSSAALSKLPSESELAAPVAPRLSPRHLLGICGIGGICGMRQQPSAVQRATADSLRDGGRRGNRKEISFGCSGLKGSSSIRYFIQM
mmetsp:Transcript_138966/g.443743  ORF Transcript_138966/g.443743 Transcript_138966/m.443743 type:complete len:228 (+) Transcript_138966:76-759(+)